MVNKIFKGILGHISSLVATVVIWLLSFLLNVPFWFFLVSFVVYSIPRMAAGKDAMHYKFWLNCFFWSTATFLSFYLLFDAGIVVSLLITFFSGLVTTDKCNISDIFMWSGRQSKHQDLMDYVKYNADKDEVIEFSDKLKKKDELLYIIFKYRFRDQLTFSEISNRLDYMDGKTISNHCNSIALALRFELDL